MIRPEDIEILDEAFGKVRVFAAGVRESEREAAWFREVVAALLEAAAVEYGHLKLGLNHSTSLLAWACRNLLELDIYTQYVLASESNARRFASNRVADGIDTLDSFKTWLARNDASLPTPEVDAALAQLNELRAREEEPPPHLYSLKYLAAEVGLADEYGHMAKISSKLAQPGVFNVTASELDLEPLQAALFRAGAGYGMEMYERAFDAFADDGWRLKS